MTTPTLDKVNKLLELRKAATQSYVTEHDKFPHFKDCLIGVDCCDQEPFVIADLNRHMENWKNDLAFIFYAANHISEIAQAFIEMSGELDRVKSENESMNGLVGLEYHPCKTGDCPHEKQTECDSELSKIENHHGFVPFTVTGNGFSKVFARPIKVIDFKAVQVTNQINAELSDENTSLKSQIEQLKRELDGRK